MKRDDLQALRERVEKADPADEIALEILTEDVLRAVHPASVKICKRHFEEFGVTLKYPPILASIDAAVALIERKLPGWGFSVTTKAGWSWACINEPDAKVEIVRGEAKTPALALIAALLNALENANERR